MATREQINNTAQLLRDCAGWDEDAIAHDRVLAYRYYHQRPRGDELPDTNRSDVVAGDLSAMVESNLAQMLDAFENDNLFRFHAVNGQDEDQSLLETAAVKHLVMDQQNGYWAIGEAVKDTLLLRNGFCKILVEDASTDSTREVENVEPEGIPFLENEFPGAQTEVISYDREAKTATVRATVTIKQFIVESVPPENALYTRDWKSHDVQKIPLFAERHVDTRQHMIDVRGFPAKKVNMLAPFSTDQRANAHARDVREQGRQAKNAVDKAQEEIEWFECYVLLTRNGRTERRRLSLAGQSQQSELEDVPATIVPYCTGQAFINQHRLTGISLFDKLRQVQDNNTSLDRALNDNINTNNKNRTAYLDGMIEPEALEDGRINSDIPVSKMAGDVRQAIFPFTVPDLSDGILKNRQHQNNIRAEMGGASLDMASGEMQLGQLRGSEGVDRAYSVKEALAAHMTKNIARSLLRSMFLLAHEVIRQEFDAPIDFKSDGAWFAATPSEWRQRFAITIRPGMSPGERARRVAALREVVSNQFALAKEELDDVLVNIEGFHRALTDLARAQDLPNPELYYLDPRQPEQRAKLAEKRAAAQQAAEAQRAMMTQAISLEQLRIALDKYQGDGELVFKYFEAVLDAEVEEAKITGDALVDLLKAKREANTNVETTSGPGAANGSGNAALPASANGSAS